MTLAKVGLVASIAMLNVATADAVTVYLDLTAGFSRRAQAAKVLGQPVLTLAEILHEHAPQQDTGPIFVEYQLGSDMIERIEVTLLKPVDRAEAIEGMRLPSDPVASRISNGRLIEYFGEGASVALTYATTRSGSGVTSIAYESDAKFARDVERAKAEPPPTTEPGPGPAPPAPPAPTPEPPPPPTVSTLPPSVKRDPIACYDLFLWANSVEQASRQGSQVARRQKAMAVRLAAQSGDCSRARELQSEFKKQFPND